MAINLLPLGSLGAVENNGSVTFGIWLPDFSADKGISVTVKIIHERDYSLQNILPSEFALTHSVREPYGDFWSGTVPIKGMQPGEAGSAWGTEGRYLYRYQVNKPNVGSFDWIIDPCAREFGPGKFSAFTLGYQPYIWSAAETNWQIPELADLIRYEVNIAKLGSEKASICKLLDDQLKYHVNAIEVMPLYNLTATVDWGYLPIGHFGVDERFGNRAAFQLLVDEAHQRGIAVIVDMVYGHTGDDFPYYDLYTRLKYHKNPFMGPLPSDKYGHSTDFNRKLTRDYFYSVNNYWLETCHVDGFRYDCVPGYRDDALGNGYGNLMYATRRLAKQNITAGKPYWNRFDGGEGAPLRIIYNGRNSRTRRGHVPA